MDKMQTLTREQAVLLALIHSSLWGTKPPDHADDAMEQAKVQALVPLLFPASAEAAQYSVHYIRILYAQDALTALMDSANIPAVILKGSAAAIYYPEPFLRTMGDIDFIVPADRFQEAADLMSSHGYTLAHEKHDLDRHISFQKDGVTLEMHIRFSSEGIDVERYVKEGIEHPETAVLEGHSFAMLPPLENGIVLLAHAAQHLKKDLGMRQVIDWMMYVDKVLDDELWNHEFQSVASACGLEILALTMTRMCQLYLGLSEKITWCKNADPILVEALMNNILETGNFGRKHGYGSRVERVSIGIRRFGLFHYLQIAGEYNWRAYHKHQWLKLFCWLYQIFRYARQGLRSGRSKEQLTKDIDRAKSRHDLLTRLGLE